MKQIILILSILAFLVSGCSPSMAPAKTMPDSLEQAVKNPDGTAPYMRLAEKSVSELTSSDFKLFLTTPVEKLANIYGSEIYTPPTIPENADGNTKQQIEDDIFLFHYYGMTCEIPIDALYLNYNEAGENVLPRYIEIYSKTEIVSGVQLGSTFSDIMAQWGETTRNLYNNPLGYWGTVYQYIEYSRDGLLYHFQCSEAIDRYEPWYQLDESEWTWENFPQVVDTVIISIEAVS